MQRLLVLEAVAQQTIKSLFVNVVVHYSEGVVSVIQVSPRAGADRRVMGIAAADFCLHPAIYTVVAV